MKLLAIFAHPAADSFNHALLQSVVRGAEKAKHEIQVRNLYEMDFLPSLNSGDFERAGRGEVASDVLAEQEKVKWADHLIWIYPLWWYGLPAILKGWVDRVFQKDFAFEVKNGEIQGLLGSKKATILCTAGMPKEKLVSENAEDWIIGPLAHGTLGFCGIRGVDSKVYYQVGALSDTERQQILLDLERQISLL